MAAASVVLLAGSIWWIMNLKTENQSLKDNTVALQSSLKIFQDSIAQVIAEAEYIQKEGMKMAGLNATANSPKSYATVYWDTTSHDVYLLVNNLPKSASDEQYQLWALLKTDNQLQTINLGFLQLSQKPLQAYKMTNARAAQAFAITLEKKDGNPTANLEKIYSMSNL